VKKKRLPEKERGERHFWNQMVRPKLTEKTYKSKEKRGPSINQGLYERKNGKETEK